MRETVVPCGWEEDRHRSAVGAIAAKMKDGTVIVAKAATTPQIQIGFVLPAVSVNPRRTLPPAKSPKTEGAACLAGS